MLNKKNIVLVATLTAFPIVGSASISDWLVTSGTGSSPNSWTDTVNDRIQVFLDDDNTGEENLNPGSGGQDYDAEAMYVDFNNNTLSIAIVTGLEPIINDGKYFSGDILFDTKGGPTGSGGSSTEDVTQAKFETGNIGIGDDGTYFDYEYAMTTYQHVINVYDESGNDIENIENYDQSTASAGELYRVDGDLYEQITEWERISRRRWREVTSETDVDSWKYGPAGSNDETFKEAHPTIADYGVLVGKDDSFSYGDGFVGGVGIAGRENDDHYIIEASIDLGEAGSRNTTQQEIFTALMGGNLNLHWNPTCNNDILMAQVDAFENPAVPEPASLALMGLGLFGLVGFRRKEET